MQAEKLDKTRRDSFLRRMYDRNINWSAMQENSSDNAIFKLFLLC